MPHGHLVEKSTYAHVNRAKMDRIMSSIQATYQREMFRYFGVDLNSQEGYELASNGLLRPSTNNTPPIVYSIKCVELKKPFFKLEIHTINETCRFLRELVHDVGYQLKTNAICTNVKRVKDGFIDNNFALPYISWNFNNIYDNISQLNGVTIENIKNYKNTVLVNSTKTDELKLLGVKSGHKLIDLHKNE
jgi:mitochondrial mRNA pseudouridine synthase TRUB2